MSRIIFYLVLGMLGYYLVRNWLGAGKKEERKREPIPPGPGQSPSPTRSFESADVVADPVCGTFVDPASALSLTRGGATHYFCSEACRDKFRAG